MADVVDGCYGDKLGHVTIIDCRYPYEYEGGHIKVSWETQYLIAFVRFRRRQIYKASVGAAIPVVSYTRCRFSTRINTKFRVHLNY